MPHAKDELLRSEALDREVQKLESLLEELGIEIPPESDLAKATRQGFAAFYYSVFPVEVPASAEEADANRAALAGMADIAAKINRARATPGFETLRPHLKNMLEGAVRMNARSPVTDAAANKNSELYVGCLALGAGIDDVQLEDPVKSAGGKNPDVLLTWTGDPWAIAVKTAHSFTATSIFGSIEKAVRQIERSGRDGIVFINLKNVVNDEHATPGPFSSPDEAQAALMHDVDSIIRELGSKILSEGWADLFGGKRARPIVAFMAQRTVPAMVPGIGFAPVAVKLIRAGSFPPAADVPVGLDADAYGLIDALNEEMQKNPPSG